MERLLYVGIGGLLLGDRADESFRHPYQVRAGLSLHFVQDLTAHGLLRRIRKETKRRAPCTRRGTRARLACHLHSYPATRLYKSTASTISVTLT
jgi:hypothetical protein